MLVNMLGVSTPSESMMASAGRADRASDASKEEAANVGAAVGELRESAPAHDTNLWTPLALRSDDASTIMPFAKTVEALAKSLEGAAPLGVAGNTV